MTSRLGLFGTLALSVLAAACGSSSSGNTIQNPCLDAVPPSGAMCTAATGTSCVYNDTPCTGVTTEAVCKGGAWAVTVTKGVCTPTNDGGADGGSDTGIPDAGNDTQDGAADGGADAGSG